MATQDQTSDGLRARIRQQEAVAELGQRALELDDVDRLLYEATVAVSETLEAKYCEVLERLPGGGHVLLRQGVGWRDGLVGRARVPTCLDSQAGYALHSETPVVVEDLENEGRFSGSELHTSHGIVSGVSVVIGSVEDPWGALGVHTTERRAFTDGDVTFVQSVANLLASALDNQETKRRLRTAEERTERILETSPVGILQRNTDGKIEFANDRAAEILGRDRSVLESMTNSVDEWGFVDVDGEPLPSDRIPSNWVLADEGSVFGVELGVTRPDGEVVWLSVNAEPFRDDEGSVTGVILAFEDVTDRKGIEREIKATNRTLQQLYEITADRERSFDEKIDRLLELGRERLGLESGFLANIDRDTDRFEITHAVGDDDRIRPGAAVPLSETYCQVTIESDEPVAFTELPIDERISDEVYDLWELDCYLGGAVHVDGALYGTLCFEDRNARSSPFTESETTFVELATQWVSYELERQRRQRALEESEQRYRTIIDHFPNGAIGLFDEDLRYTVVGGDLLDELEIAHEEVAGASIYEQYPEEVVSVIEPKFREALDGVERTFQVEYRGRDLWIQTVPIRNEDGDVFAGMLMAQDITTRREQERRLEERERLLEEYKAFTDDVLDAIDDVFYIVDEVGYLERWNESVREVTGYTDEEIESMYVLEFFDEADHETIANGIQEVLETGSARVEATAMTKDGKRIPYEYIAVTLEDLSGNRVIAGVGRDITERVEHRQQLEQLINDLEASNERLEQFAYAASHDLQEPLRMVSSYLQLIERRYDDALDEDGQEFLAFAVDGADRMREMIDGLLQYSRIETRGDPFEPVDLETVVSETLTDLEVKIAETDADVTVGSLPCVLGDERQLRQLFQNLIHNAIKYVEDERPDVHVTAERRNGLWAVSVRDNGIGIDPDDADRVFEVFQRLHSVDEYAGAGIGLALCQRIVERHGGRIWVDSEPGAGSTFGFTLVPPDGEPPNTASYSPNDAAETNDREHDR